jgi:hypothetical protein
MLKRLPKVLLVFLLFGPLVAQAPAETAEKPVPRIHVVLFVAAGLEAPADAEVKIAAAAEFAERFFVKWMRHWGYAPAREQVFTRHDGRIRVLHVRGSKPPQQYSQALGLLRELWPKAHEAYGLARNNPLGWVWVYKGDPPTRFSNYRGSGDLRRGGWAVVNYENRPGPQPDRCLRIAGIQRQGPQRRPRRRGSTATAGLLAEGVRLPSRARGWV